MEPDKKGPGMEKTEKLESTGLAGKKGRKPETPDWDAIDKLGEGDNPLSDERDRRETVWFCLLLSLAGFVFVGVWTYLEFPPVRRLGALPLIPLGFALYTTLSDRKK